jgi:hypothetical protein
MAKCVECGYLGVRDEYTRNLVEADEDTRRTADHSSSGDRKTPARFVCSQNIRSFENLDTSAEKLESINSVIQCDRITRIVPGRSPQQIEDMDTQQAIVALNAARLRLDEASDLFQRSFAEWKKQLAEERSQWDKYVEDRTQTRHQESRDDSAESGRDQKMAEWRGYAVQIIAPLIVSAITGATAAWWVVQNSAKSEPADRPIQEAPNLPPATESDRLK